MTEHFQGLEQEKRERILNAGYQIFGKHGYRKASTADIAREAGISKAMLFYYFVSKKELYLDLIQEASNVLLSAMNARLETISTDFFDRVLALSRTKIEALKKHPFLTQFLYSVFGETDPEVRGEIGVHLSSVDVLRNEMVVSRTDTEKFKEGIAPEVVLEIMMNCALGLFSVRTADDCRPEMIERYMERFQEYLELFKNNFYKEEYL